MLHCSKNIFTASIPHRTMRLLNTCTGKFEEFHDSKIPPYAILSHTWPQKGEGAEQTYEDVRKVQETCKLVVLEQEISSPISHSTPLAVAERVYPPAALASDAVTTAFTAEAGVAADREYMHSSMSTSALE